TQVDVGFTLVDNDGDKSSATVTFDTTIPQPLPVANLMFTIDVSGSMTATDGVNGQTRLQSEIDSITKTINNYADLGDVRVMVVSYQSTASQLSSTWMTAYDAIVALKTLVAGGGTNYDAAVAATQTAYASSGKLAGVETIGYFFSDGEPTGSQGITGNEITAWQNFLDTNDIKEYALGVGSGVTTATVAANMDQLAYDGITGTDTDAVKVNSFADLDKVLADTVFRVGTTGDDVIVGTTGNDIIVGGAGNDVMTGDLGSDVFKWGVSDAGTTAHPAIDTITDFNAAAPSAGGDVLNLKDLLVGEAHNGDALDNYLHFESDGSKTTIYISNTGAFADNHNVGAPTADVASHDVQQIVLKGVDLTAGFTTDAQVINNLIAQNKLITD
ncbi:MAG: type I secretion C-terminal target domain-containing protein, partial [Methylophilus sp.]